VTTVEDPALLEFQHSVVFLMDVFMCCAKALSNMMRNFEVSTRAKDEDIEEKMSGLEMVQAVTPR